MKTAWIIGSIFLLFFTACESTDDVLNNIDHIVPAITFSTDTLEVAAGETITVNAVIEDDSGIQRIEFSYGDWRINNIKDLSEEPNTATYPFSMEFTVPADATKEWQEDLFFKDGSSIKIIQHYHKLSLSAWDKNRNLNKGYLYVKVK